MAAQVEDGFGDLRDMRSRLWTCVPSSYLELYGLSVLVIAIGDLRCGWRG